MSYATCTLPRPCLTLTTSCLTCQRKLRPRAPTPDALMERQKTMIQVSIAGSLTLPDVCTTKQQTSEVIDLGDRTTHLVLGEGSLRKYFREIFELRVRCGQQDDWTTHPEYFIAANLVKTKRVGAVLIRNEGELEGCVFLYEYCQYGVRLGVFRAGDQSGESLAIGQKDLRMQHIALATRALLGHWRVHGLRLATSATSDEFAAVLGPENKHRTFFSENLPHKLLLESTYDRMLSSMGARTRRSLATKRRQLESRNGAAFVPSLEPALALEAMLSLRSRSKPLRGTDFYRARYSLACAHPEFFSMGVCSPDGTWLSVLSGWRREGLTYVDLQMNDAGLKKESLSAVMRAFMLEQEINNYQKLVTFVDGTSLLLRRYCQAADPCACAYLGRPGLRGKFFHAVMRQIDPEVFSRVFASCGDDAQVNDINLAVVSDLTEATLR
jgi:hypothetical protein